MNLVISDPKTAKAYSKKIDNASLFIGKKIGDEIDLSAIGLEGYAAKITGGSDKEGFPMRKGLSGSSRRKILITVNKKKGIKVKKSVRGCVVSDEIQQLNLVVTKYGTKSLEEIFPKAEAKDDTKSTGN